MNNDETGVVKSDYARNIELFDIKNLTPENIEYMVQVVREYFRAKFPVQPELVDDVLRHMNIVSDEEFRRAFVESGKNVNDVETRYGFYDKKNNVGYINKDKHRTSGEIFVTIFHESLHAVSISAGAGFRGDFVSSFGADETERKEAMERGLVAFIEGTTHYITLNCVIGDMGFDGTDNMLRYKAERTVMSQIWDAFPAEALYKAYFVTPIEGIRRHFDMTVAPEESRKELAEDSSRTNGQFVDFLIHIGAATGQINELLESGREDEGAFMKIHNDIMHAVGYFLVYERQMTGKPFTDEEKETLGEYLKPYLGKLS